MQLQIQSLHFKAGQELTELIEKKLQKAFGNYPYISRGLVTLKNDNNDKVKNQVMEVKLSVTNAEFFAKAEEETFEKGLDQVIPKLKKQLDKYKDKVYSKS